MEKDVLAYVTHEKITDWKRLTLARMPQPEYVYGSSDSKTFKDSVGPGANLWIFSCVNGWSPVLVARLLVTATGSSLSPKLNLSEGLRRHYRNFNWIALGDPQKSLFFGHNDAGRALAQTVVERKDGLNRLGERGRSWNPKYYQKLRRPTVVAEEGRRQDSLISPGSSHLEELAGFVEHSVFISWKWRGNFRRRRSIREFTRSLAELKVMVWLDLLAFPMSPALAKLRKDNDRLEKLLKYGYAQCKAVLALGTKHFGKLTREIPNNKNWTEREWTGEILPGKQIKRVVYPLETEIPAILKDADHYLEKRNPKQAAKELREYLDSFPDQG